MERKVSRSRLAGSHRLAGSADELYSRNYSPRFSPVNLFTTLFFLSSPHPLVSLVVMIILPSPKFKYAGTLRPKKALLRRFCHRRWFLTLLACLPFVGLLRWGIRAFNSTEVVARIRYDSRGIESIISESPDTPEWKNGSWESLTQTSPKLQAYIVRKYIIQPSPFGGNGVDWTPLHLTVRYKQQEVVRFVLNLFFRKNYGTFIEAGANDGEYFSNTMLLERWFNWSGVLIEGDPRPLKRLVERNRAAYIAKCCLSTSIRPKKITFLRHTRDEGLSFIRGKRHFIGREEDYHAFESQCFPLYAILSALNLTTVDYFSLDIEGAELDVLKTIPWENVLIKVLSIEVHATYVTPVKNYMTGEAGYKYITFIQNGYSHDQIYAHKSIMHELDKRVVDGKR
ncbi:uncharacterized protein LOC110861992 isoform X2 [Folsomia candida]|nr:uncharacterized protein LOC110861992 isoform X2 [Folsomia candida]